MNSIIRLFIFSILISSSVFAQEPTFQNSLLDRLSGKWILRGTIAGTKTTHDIQADWVLGHQYLKLVEVSREKKATGEAEYEAIVFIGWDQPSEGYACLWLDNTGGGGLVGEAIGHAKQSGNEIPFLFHSPDGSIFHNRFTFNPDNDEWQWAMDNETSGKLQPFARVTLTRK
ncbi:MAG TPA: hypothetical protein VLR52_06360 [Bacteroidales bacterium]|nr:hypothetical protein [Bacteroidales bacterium]